MKRFLLLAVAAMALFAVPKSLFAQEKFELQQQKSHYYFTAAIAGVKADIMLESGIPALLVGRDFYEKNLKNCGLTFEASERQIRLVTNLYPIAFRADGKLPVGNLVFDGPIFVLDEFSGVSMPIQYLKMADGKKAFIALDLPRNTMLVSDQKPDVKGEKFKLRTDKKLGFPIVNSALKMDTENGSATLKGDFIVDFGNPELLFLMQQNKAVKKVMQSGKLTLVDVISEETFEVIGNAIMTQSAEICGRRFEGKCIVVTDKMPTIEQLGLLGLPFFQKTVIFDFAGGEMIVTE